MDDLFFERINDFVYGDCSEDEFSEFKKHMESCEMCKEEYEFAVSMKQAMSSMPKITPPADFSEMLNKRLDDELSKPVRIKPSVYRKYSALAACVALVAVLGIDSAKLTDDAFVTEPLIPFDTNQISSVPDDYTDNSSEPSLQTDAPEETPQAPAENIQIDPIQKASTKQSVSKQKPTPKSEQKKVISSKKANMPESVADSKTAETQKTVVSTHAPVQTNDTYVEPDLTLAPGAVPNPAPAVIKTTSNPPEPAKTEPTKQTEKTVNPPEAAVTSDSDDSVYVKNNIPKYMDPRENVVLASAVENDYQIKAVKPEDVPVKERDLQAEFALLENPKTGNIIANPATIASLEGVQIKEIKSNGTGAHEYGVGSGSIFISTEDQDTVNELLNKYQSQEDHSVYYFTGENFNSFTNELDDNGISYEKRLISQDGSNVAFKVVAS